MKRKIISLILVLMLIPIASIFGACGNDGYNLNKLEKNFNSIAKENNNVGVNNNALYFDYSSHEDLSIAVATIEPYTELKNYNYVFSNLMAFVYNYIDECSDNDVTKNVKLKNQLKKELDELKESIKDVNLHVNYLAGIITVTEDDNSLSEACLTGYENLLLSYDNLYLAGANFSNTLARLYFNYVLKDGNPNVYKLVQDDYSKNQTKFDVNVIINKLDSRLKYQQSNLSQSYAAMHIIGGDISKMIAAGIYGFTLDLSQYDYLNNILKVNRTFNEQTASEVAGSSAKKEVFYNLSVKAYNIQKALNNDFEKYSTALNDISYRQTLMKIEKTAYEQMCADIIEQHQYLIQQYTVVLSDMINLVTGA